MPSDQNEGPGNRITYLNANQEQTCTPAERPGRSTRCSHRRPPSGGHSLTVRHALAAVLLAGMLGLPESGRADFDAGQKAAARGDYAIARREYLEAAMAGDARAQCQLGDLYYLGRGGPKDSREALHWYRAAAEQGHSRCLLWLGTMYENGLETQPDHQAAADFYRIAAERGDAKAQFRLAKMYRRGRGLPQDPVNAFFWFSMAAAQGNREAAYLRDVVAAGMTPKQIEEAQERIRSWAPRSS